MSLYLCKVQPVRFPEPTGIAINMMPFVMGDPDSIPEGIRPYQALIDACNLEREQFGKIGYLSIEENAVTAKQPTQRRAGIHTDRHPSSDWGGGWGGGWGRGSAANGVRRDGIYMASSIGDSCRAWDVGIDAPGKMGDCEHLRESLENTPAVLMRPDVLYWLTDRTPHESLPMAPGTFRQWFRLVTHKVGLWYKLHSTANPLGVLPDCKVVNINKFAANS